MSLLVNDIHCDVEFCLSSLFIAIDSGNLRLVEVLLQSRLSIDLLKVNHFYMSRDDRLRMPQYVWWVKEQEQLTEMSVLE